MSNYPEQYPGLTQFFWCYLHQDWALDYPNVWGAVDDFARSEPDHAPLMDSEIKALLTDSHSEADLEHVVAELDGNYRPEINGETYRGWLAAVAERVDKVRRNDTNQ
jgi:hypothetical protein